MIPPRQKINDKKCCVQKRRRVVRRGFTLVELVVALTLASLLLTALTGVLKSLAMQAKRSTESRATDISYAIEAIVWHDLSQARSVALTNGVLWMLIPGPPPISSQSYDSQYLRSGAGTSKAHIIAYRLVPAEGVGFSLVRQAYIGSQMNGVPIFEQTIAWNVEKTAFERIDDNGDPQPLPKQLGPTPAALAYRISFVGETQTQTTRVYAR
jgi:prepilin-type N-terminal cleavage/methylation domain-containing protein